MIFTNNSTGILVQKNTRFLEKGGIFDLKKYSFCIEKGVYLCPKILEKGVFAQSWNTR